MKKIKISLLEENPPFLKEWDKSKNLGLDPSIIASHARAEIWWKCSTCNHEWKARVSTRWDRGCSKCGIEKMKAKRAAFFLERSGSLEEKFPLIAKEWDTSNDLKPNQIAPGSGKVVKWKCAQGHSWKTSVSNRTNGTGCPFCAGKLENSQIPKTLLSELDPELNKNIDVSSLSQGSSKKLWWVCSKGHKWQASVNSRARNGSGCLYCTRQLTLPEDSIEKLRPDLMTQWDWGKNKSLDPSSIALKSGKRAHWICQKGHEWSAVISSRTSGRGCPYCGNKKVSKDNNLAFLHPDIAKEWDSEKNDGALPSEFVPGSGKRAWWKCARGHSWLAQINSRIASGPGCPICSPQTSKLEIRVRSEFESLLGEAEGRKKIGGRECDIFFSRHKLCIEVDGYPWHMEKVESDERKTKVFEDHGYKLIRLREKRLPPIYGSYAEFSDGDNLLQICKNLALEVAKKIELTNEEKTRFSSYQHSTAFTNEDRFKTLLNDVAIQPTGKSLVELRPEIAAQWDSLKNGVLSPALFSLSSGHKAWWLCEKGHSYDCTITNRTRGHGCPFCSGNKVLPQDSLELTHPALASQWITSKNNIDISLVAWGSSRKVWWKCEKGHEWQASIVHRAHGSGCPYCSGRLASKEANLTVTNPEVSAQWNYEKNDGLLPDNFKAGCHKKVWWKCLNKHEWQAEIKSRALGKRGCPLCRTSKRITSP